MDELDGGCCNTVLHVRPPEINIFVDQQFELKELAPIFGNFNRSM